MDRGRPITLTQAPARLFRRAGARFVRVLHTVWARSTSRRLNPRARRCDDKGGRAVRRHRLGRARDAVIGTAPGEWVTERPRLRFGFEAEGLSLEPGRNPMGYREGSMGWFVDEPYYGFPSGGGMRTRLTAVVREEEGRWKIVHMHVSVGVPDEEVQELQARWGVR
jgi:SnoaL-like protein